MGVRDAGRVFVSVALALGLLVANAAFGPAMAVSARADEQSTRPALDFTTWKQVRSAAEDETAALKAARASGKLDKEERARGSALLLWDAVTVLTPRGSSVDRSNARAALESMLVEIGRVHRDLVVARLKRCTAGSIPNGSIAQGLLVDDMKLEAIRAGLIAVLGKNWSTVVNAWEKELTACMQLSLSVNSNMEVGTSGVPGTWATSANQVIPLSYDVLNDHWTGSTGPSGITIVDSNYVPSPGCTVISKELAQVPVDFGVDVSPSHDGKKILGVELTMDYDLSALPVDKVTVECPDGQGGVFTSVHELAPWMQSWSFQRNWSPIYATDWSQSTNSYVSQWKATLTEPNAELTERSSLTLIHRK